MFQDPDAPGQTEGPVSSALASLNRYYRWTRVLPVAGAFERVLEDSGYLALAATTLIAGVFGWIALRLYYEHREHPEIVAVEGHGNTFEER